MAEEKFEKNKESDINKESAIKPDKETLNTTDPQEHMQGPFSSLMQVAEDTFGGKKTKKDAKEKLPE